MGPIMDEAPSSRPQAADKLQSPNAKTRVPTPLRLGLGLWRFSGVWTLDLGASYISHGNLHRRLVLGHAAGGEDATPVDARVDDRVATNDAAGVEHGIAADLAVIADERAELSQAGVDAPAVHFDADIALDDLHVGQHHARAEVRFVTEDGVADVIEVRHLAVVEDECVLQLAGISDDAAIADDHVFAEVGVVADLTVAPDDGRAFDHRAVLDHCALADKDIRANERLAIAAVAKFRAEMGLQVVLDFLQRVPA